MRRSGVFPALLVAAASMPAAAAPFAVTLLTPETIQMVDLGSVRRSGETVAYRTVMMTQPSPDLAEGRLGHLLETREARCAAGEGRRLTMGAVMSDGEDMSMAVPDDPWAPVDPAELKVVCAPAPEPASVLPSLEAARAALTSAAPPP